MPQKSSKWKLKKINFFKDGSELFALGGPTHRRNSSCGQLTLCFKGDKKGGAPKIEYWTEPPTQWNLGAADEAVLNNVHKKCITKPKKSPLKKSNI
jgi:hypothetical protein